MDPSDRSCALVGYTFYGEDIKDIPSEGYESCSIACADTAGCKSFSLRTTDNRCFLKKKYGGVFPIRVKPHEPNMISRNMQCDTSPIDFSCARKSTKLEGSMFHAADSSGIGECARLCRMAEMCRSFYISNNRYCWYATKVGGDIGPVPAGSHVTSMTADCSAETKSKPDPETEVNPLSRTCSLVRFNFIGEDIKDIPVTPSDAVDSCTKACLATAGCKSFSLRTSDFRCFLKKKYGGVFPVRTEDIVSRNMKCDRSLLDVSCARKSTILKGSHYYSGKTREGLQECAMLCRIHEQCKSFYFDSSKMFCWYFDKLGGDEGPVNASSQFTSMVKDCRPYTSLL